ncbi:hypothetical protein O1L60_18425 [Streptomyces diastatochromogenes]|nr:hypothetical protein [Streptomyces diastatochromogenes]
MAAARSNNGARLPAPPRGEPAEASIGEGVVLYALRYPSTNSREAAPTRAPHVFPTAREAVRALRVQVRTAHVFGMTPAEVERAVEWAEEGWFMAQALLNAGEACGFDVVGGNGVVAEWSARPVRYLELCPADRHIDDHHGARRTESAS